MIENLEKILLDPDTVTKLTTPDPKAGDMIPHAELITEGIGTLSGKGVLDEVMKAVDEHLQREFKAQRITGSNYSNLYIQALNTVIQTSSQFALSGAESYWKAKLAEAEYRHAEAQILKALADVDTQRLQVKIQEKELELKEKELTLKEREIAQKDEEIANMKYQAWATLQKVLTEQAETQDMIGTIDPAHIGDPTTVFTPTKTVKGTVGVAREFQAKQTSELERTAVRSLADHYKSAFDTNQTSLNDLKPYAFGYNGSRVKAVENLLLSKFGLDGPSIDAQHPEAAEADREEE